MCNKWDMYGLKGVLASLPAGKVGGWGVGVSVQHWYWCPLIWIYDYGGTPETTLLLNDKFAPSKITESYTVHVLFSMKGLHSKFVLPPLIKSKATFVSLSFGIWNWETLPYLNWTYLLCYVSLHTQVNLNFNYKFKKLFLIWIRGL